MLFSMNMLYAGNDGMHLQYLANIEEFLDHFKCVSPPSL